MGTTLKSYMYSQGYCNNLYDNLNQIKSKPGDEQLRLLEFYEIQRLVWPSLGDADVSDLTSLSFLNIYNRMRRSNYSEESVRRLHTVLSDIFIEMETDGIIPENPIRYLQVEELRSMPDSYLTPAELNKMMQQVEASGYLNLYRFALYSGLRMNIMLALSSSDINWETGLVTSNKLISTNEENHLYELRKSIAEWSMRKFYLSKKALCVLSDEMEIRKQKEAAAKSADKAWKNEDDLIFCDDTGHFILPWYTKRDSQRWCGNTGAHFLYRQFEIGSFEDLKEEDLNVC